MIRWLLALALAVAPAGAKPSPKVRLTVDGELHSAGLPADADLALKRLGPASVREAVAAGARLLQPDELAFVDYFLHVHLNGLDAEVAVTTSAPPSKVRSRTVFHVAPAHNATDQLAKMREAFLPLVPRSLREFRAAYIHSFALPQREIAFVVPLPAGLSDEARQRWPECAVATWNLDGAAPVSSDSAVVDYRLPWPVGVPADRIVGSYAEPTLFPGECDPSLSRFTARIEPIAGGIAINLVPPDEDEALTDCRGPGAEERRRAEKRREALRSLFAH